MTADPAHASHGGPAAVKARLRAAMRTARVELSPAGRAAATTAACRLLEQLPELQGTGPFLLYAATGDELSLDPLIRALLDRGAQVCLPRVRGAELDVCLVGGTAELTAGWRGVREPAPDALVLGPEPVSAAVVPGLAFDARGNRLGYGGGHFDRLLARLPATTPVIAAAYDVQVVGEVPAEAHDRPVHVIVTESRIIRTR